MIETRLLRHALALGEHRNFARAAAALNLTQPSLSRSIALLERELGVPLFDRSRKGVTPTVYGRVVLERGETVLKREADVRREIRLLAGLDQGSLAIGAGPYAAESSVARAAARVARAHPRLAIKCTSADPAEVVRDVLAERIDIGITTVEGLDRESRLTIEPLAERRAFFACRPGHPLTREPSPTFARALEFPLVTTLLRGTQAAAVASRGRANNADAPDFVPGILVNSVALARLIARESDAVFPGTIETLADDVTAGRLVLLDIDAPALRVQYAVFYLRDRTLSPATRVFIEALHAIDASVAAAENGAIPAHDVDRSRAIDERSQRNAGAPPARRRERVR